jgi:hypothetical protein
MKAMIFISCRAAPEANLIVLKNSEKVLARYLYIKSVLTISFSFLITLILPRAVSLTCYFE